MRNEYLSDATDHAILYLDKDFIQIICSPGNRHLLHSDYTRVLPSPRIHSFCFEHALLYVLCLGRAPLVVRTVPSSSLSQGRLFFPTAFSRHAFPVPIRLVPSILRHDAGRTVRSSLLCWVISVSVPFSSLSKVS